MRATCCTCAATSAYDHCRPAGGVYGDQSGLALETDEAPIERDWLASSALTVGWRRFGHILEPNANQRLIRDQASAAAWVTDRSRQHFTAVAPTLTFRPARQFGRPIYSAKRRPFPYHLILNGTGFAARHADGADEGQPVTER